MIEVVSWFGVALIALCALVGFVGLVGTSLMLAVHRLGEARTGQHSRPGKPFVHAR